MQCTLCIITIRNLILGDSNLGNLFLHQSCPMTAGMSGRSSGSVASIHLSNVSRTLSTCVTPVITHFMVGFKLNNINSSIRCSNQPIVAL